MVKVTIYTTKICPHCRKAKKLFEIKNVPYKEVDVSFNLELHQEMVKKAEGRRTVPQIFIDGKPIGGCDDLYQLECDGKLDELLGVESIPRDMD